MVLRTMVLAGAVWLVATSAGLAAGTTQLSVSASAVEPGETVDVSATGFAPGAALSVSLDGTALASTAADDTGAVRASVQVPYTTLPGRHVVAVGDAQAPLVVEKAQFADVVEGAIASRGVGTLRFDVYLPAGYAASGARYPVVYFLHGLPAGGAAYRAWRSFVVERMRLLASRAIVVVPQAARDDDSDPEYLDWGRGRNWATAIAVELPHYVDTHFRTIANRSARALVGVSAGGYGATMLGLHHLGSFSVIESWSGYFEPTSPDGTRTLDLGSRGANAGATAFTYVPQLNALFRRQPTFLGFYVGRSDDLFRPDNLRLHSRLVAEGVPHAFAVYGGGHQTSLWSAHADTWLGLALQHLAAPLTAGS